MWRKAVQLQKTALRESFLEVIRLFWLFVKCGGYSYKKLLALAIQIASAILLA